MTPDEVHDALLALARELGLEVRRMGPTGEEVTASGVCRLRGRVLVLLASGDPLAEKSLVLARGVLAHDPGACEERFLPPALRELLERAAPPGGHDAPGWPGTGPGPGA